MLRVSRKERVMRHAVEIEFQGLQEDEARHAVEARARSKVARLERDFPGLEDCRISVLRTLEGSPPQDRFTVSIEVAASGGTLRHCALNENDVFTALRGAFDGIRLLAAAATPAGASGIPGTAAFVASRKDEPLTEDEQEESMPHLRWDG
jgi:hypothetical protein